MQLHDKLKAKIDIDLFERFKLEHSLHQTVYSKKQKRLLRKQAALKPQANSRDFKLTVKLQDSSADRTQQLFTQTSRNNFIRSRGLDQPEQKQTTRSQLFFEQRLNSRTTFQVEKTLPRAFSSTNMAVKVYKDRAGQASSPNLKIKLERSQQVRVNFPLSSQFDIIKQADKKNNKSEKSPQTKEAIVHRHLLTFEKVSSNSIVEKYNETKTQSFKNLLQNIMERLESRADRDLAQITTAQTSQDFTAKMSRKGKLDYQNQIQRQVTIQPTSDRAETATKSRRIPGKSQLDKKERSELLNQIQFYKF